MTIDGVRLERTLDSASTICIVEHLTPDLEEKIRTELHNVCHGAAKTIKYPTVYTYKKTLAEFLKRYDAKSDSTKLGMLGELLCHILLFSFCPQFKAASPYFNMEEGSIKKGFDVIISSSAHNDLCIAEVKSGEIGKSTRDQKVRELIDLAKNDLISRLSDETNDTIWLSAVNNVEVSVRSGETRKEILIERIHKFLTRTESVTDRLKTTHAILVPVLFENVKNSILLAEIDKKLAKILCEVPFSSLIIFAIQKSTLKKIEEFLRNEGA